MVQEWHEGRAPDIEGVHGNRQSGPFRIGQKSWDNAHEKIMITPLTIIVLRNIAVALMQILWSLRTTYMVTWQVTFVEGAVAGKPIHWARILWGTTRQHIGEVFKGSVNYVFPFFINFYREMGLLTTAEQKKFLLKREIADDKGALEGNEVASEENDIALALPSAEADKSENEINERPKKKKKLQRVATSEILDQRAGLRVQRSICKSR
ncbi:hypothetical protein AXG93_978s1000 [Marchantia polymorpha subsp. ruderalis]|uniref:Uncharacterized protein n=1 Tax=Marchantia polymorpha subsp. ruderalis TaxID=1480154 RepID=A0A176WMW7_MARPO|nr:hypothetical protein AXG93_978s1000 [Marchantia polymorpha subsp. ruderalis]